MLPILGLLVAEFEPGAFAQSLAIDGGLPVSWSTNLIWAPTSGSTNGMTFLPGRSLKRQSAKEAKLLTGKPAALRPGIYESKPFTALILVPERHPDERFTIGPSFPWIDPNMPILHPELQLLPRK